MTIMRALKKELRKRVKQSLNDIPDSAIAAQTAHVTKTLLSLPEYRAAKRISIYLSMPSGEISTNGIVRDALGNGKQVFVPYTYKLDAPQEGRPASIMDMVELRDMADFDSFQSDKWGIPTPPQESVGSRAKSFENEAQDSGLDLIVMPGMAFDRIFGRLGHGMGYYDDFLRRCESTSQVPFRIGLALTEQLLPPAECVPMDNSDYFLDALAVGDGTLLRA